MTMVRMVGVEWSKAVSVESKDKKGKVYKPKAASKWRVNFFVVVFCNIVIDIHVNSHLA